MSAMTFGEIPPFGDVAIAPAGLTGIPEADLARRMAAHLTAVRPSTGAEALTFLRRAFPHSPLTVRAAALSAMMRR